MAAEELRQAEARLEQARADERWHDVEQIEVEVARARTRVQTEAWADAR